MSESNKICSSPDIQNDTNVKPKGMSSYYFFVQMTDNAVEPQSFAYATSSVASHQTENMAFALPTFGLTNTSQESESPNSMNARYHATSTLPINTASRSPKVTPFNRAHDSPFSEHYTPPQPMLLSLPITPDFAFSYDTNSRRPYSNFLSIGVPQLSHWNESLRTEDKASEPETSKQPTAASFTASINALHQTQTNRWQQAQNYRSQVQEPPQVDPSTDSTIPNVTQNAEYWVSQITHALSNTESVKDTSSSHALRMFKPIFYDALLLEATARQIFTFLLDRCTHGFRGPAAFNKALKPVRDLEADRFATCEERLKNVIDVLKWNKRICKDVLYEDWKIRLLVNHPLGYDRDKDCQKGSNDQRRKRLQDERDKLKGAQKELEDMKMEGGSGKRIRLNDEVGRELF